MPSSHTSPTKPSSILALICLAIVHRLRPEWVAVPLSTAARSESVRPERLSRLATRTLPAFETAAAAVMRRGRPPADRDAAVADRELAVTRALLEIATSILGHVPLRSDAIRALVVGAYLRLRAQHHITQKRFCAQLAIPTRTLRSWLRRAAPAAADPPVARARAKRARPRKRPLRRGRFGFDVTVPTTQVAADTTDLHAFGVPLKLIAAQDVGGRDAELLSAVLVDDHESADLVAEVLSDALADLPGAQAITDQGTPYLADKTRAALDELEAEHAIQREADPLGKATIERAFGTVKSFARPLLTLTDQLARAVPALAQSALARATATLVLTALLRAYQAGARAARRADDARGTADVAALIRAADDSRQRARADDRSARLLLEHIHTAYDIGGSPRAFVRTFRRFALPVLRTAERTFATQAHRDDIRNRTAYFARLVRIANDDFQRLYARRRREQAQHEHLTRQLRIANDQRQAWHDDPAAHLRDALNAVATHWIDSHLLFDGTGLGTAWMRTSLGRLVDCHGSLAADFARGVFSAFARAAASRLGPDGLTAVKTVLDRHLTAIPTPHATASCAARFAATLRATGSQPRPPPSIQPC